MIFRKPYAFFIKYFRLINLILTALLFSLGYKLNSIHGVINNIYNGTLTNYSNLNSNNIGFSLYLLIFTISIILILIIILLKRKNKPLRDYLINIIYLIIIIIYLFTISDLFITVDQTVLEIATLKLYKDISLLIIFPLAYFIVRYILIAISFDLKKFNFSKDLMELKQETADDEEVELIFDKNNYKYKRGLRKWLRELKYYFLENKLFITIILIILLCVIFIFMIKKSLFDYNKVSMRKSFVAAGITFKINNIYETKYDFNNNLIKDNYKYVIVNFTVRNNSINATSIDLKRIRLIQKDTDYYPTSSFNKFFSDLGKPYKNDILKTRKNKNFIVIFQIPENNSNKYVLKFYDKTTLKNDEIVGAYKYLNITATKLNNKTSNLVKNLNETIYFDKKNYGESNLIIKNFEFKSNYIYNAENITELIYDKDINKKLLILDYNLVLDEKKSIIEYFQTHSDFFEEFISIKYIYNNEERLYNSIKVLGNVDEKIMLSVPLEIEKSTKISLIFNLRNVKIEYILK